MRVYYDRDADINLIKTKKVAIIGYGSQGHAHALNLRDSGVKEIAIGLRPGSASAKKAEAEGLKVMDVTSAAKWADVVMMLTPDELQADIYRDHLVENMKKGAALMFAHGLNVHFNLIEPRADLDVLFDRVKRRDPGIGIRITDRLRNRHDGLLLARVVEEHAIALLHFAQVPLRHGVLHAGPHRGLVGLEL